MDAGPLVALLSRDEAAHVWVAATFAGLPAPFVTCEPVLTEAFHLLSRHEHGPRQMFALLASGLLTIDFSLAAEHRNLAALVHKYRDLSMSLADACLVRMAELRPGAVVFTLDAHFRVYRRNGRQTIPVLMP